MATKQGNALTNAQKMRRRNKVTSIGHSKNSRPKHKSYNVSKRTKSCNK